MKNDIIFKNNLYDMRRNMKLTQVQLAEKSGVDVQVISRIERKSLNPNLICAARLARYLGVTVDELFGGFKELEASE